VYVSLLIFVLASFFVGLAGYSYIAGERKAPMATHGESGVTEWRLGRILSDSLFLQRKLLVVSTVVYAFIFALLDGILVYQPSVNFTLAYAVRGVTWQVDTCCGLPGSVPVGLLYLPSQHIGVELIPLSVLLMILVSVLVGLNICLLYRAYSLSRSTRSSSVKGTAGGIVGAAFGLFVGCPTCAAAFLLSMLAGTGAVAFSTFISSYQPVIAAVTLPLLLLSIFWQARSVRDILKGCSTPRV
jgi:hypothetical protein